MLHELLLALSGHPSPLLSTSTDKSDGERLQDLLSPAEAALLKSLASNLGEKHKNIRQHSTTISNGHPSMVCRAVSTAILSTHLAAFQKKILEVERGILEEDPNLVGAYNIVPLSGLVGAFDGWNRKLEWLWTLAQFMQPAGAKETREDGSNHQLCTARKLLDHLRDCIHTGYPDIEQISLSLTKVAETAWLKQVSAWVLYGRLPTLGALDMFITQRDGGGRDAGKSTVYSINSHLIPEFVTESTASSILFIGKSLNNIRENRSRVVSRSTIQSSPELELLSSHLAHLSNLESPINSSRFSAAITAIRISLSKNLLQKLLPISKVLEVLQVLKNFFLLERGEFAVAFISAADERLAVRHNRSIDKSKQERSDLLANVIIKDGEVAAILAKTWTTMLSLQDTNDEDADDLDLARELLRFSIKPQASKSSASGSHSKPNLSDTTFDDFLLPVSTALKFRVPAPLDLILSSSSVEVYSQISAYLIAIRKGHQSLSQLFLLSPLRRDRPFAGTPKNSQISNSEPTSHAQQRANRRLKAIRPIWATISSATFLLTELGEYFQGQVIRSSWDTFYTWLDPSSTSHRPSSSSSSNTTTSNPTSASRPTIPSPSHDPETLSRAHNTYLSSLTHALLLTHPPFTRSLRTFLLSAAHLTALTHRLATAFNLDLISTPSTSILPQNDFIPEQETLLAQIFEAKTAVETNIHAVIAVLRKVDSQRAGGGGGGGGWSSHHIPSSHSNPTNNTTGIPAPNVMHAEEQSSFVPWGNGFGVEQLLLKIDWANRGF